MSKPRQGQKKPDGTIATPKPLCENKAVHEDPVVMERLSVQKKNKETGKRGMVKWGWGCQVCGVGVKDGIGKAVEGSYALAFYRVEIKDKKDESE